MTGPGALIDDRYRLVRQLGAGGMGVVWEAFDVRLNRPVAVKQLRTPAGSTEADRELVAQRAMREARINARLQHPYAVSIFDVVEHEGAPCLVMELVPSVPLTELTRELGALSIRETARVGAQIASALAAAHTLGIVHRDVKPGNILISDDGTAHICDFGISRAFGDTTLTMTGVVTGTPAFLAPESARGEEATFASDVYSLGATLYAAVEGEPPSGTEGHAIAVLYRVVAGELRPPERAGALTPLLAAMLSTEPAQRPSMVEVAAELSAIAEGKEPTLRPATGDQTMLMPLLVDDPVRPADGTAPTQALSITAMPDAAGAPGEGSASEAPEPPTSTGKWTPAADAHDRSEPSGPRGAVAVTSASGAPARPVSPPEPEGVRDTPATAVTPATAATSAAAVTPAGAGGPGSPASPSSRSGRTVSSASASDASTPAQPPATPIPASTPPTPPAERHHHRGLIAVIVALIVLLLAAGTALLWPNLERLTAGSAAEETTGSGATSAASPARSSQSPAGQPTAADLTQAVTDYYALLPGDTDAAWNLLTPSYQRQTGGRDSYDDFWNSIDTVTTSAVRATAPDRAEATLTYVEKRGNRKSTERRSFRLVRSDDVLKINQSSVI